MKEYILGEHFQRGANDAEDVKGVLIISFLVLVPATFIVFIFELIEAIENQDC